MEEQNFRTDQELFQDWLRGDSEAFRALLERYQGRLYRVILGWTRNPHLAEDIFQESWVRVIEHRRDFNPSKEFSCWLFQIALNLTRDHFRKEKRGKAELAPDRVESAVARGNPEEEFWEREQREKLWEAISQLSEREREVFMLRHFGGLSFQEVSELLGLNLNTTLSRMHQAVNRLKEVLGER